MDVLFLFVVVIWGCVGTCEWMCQAAEGTDYNISVDIRELVSADDVSEELKLGPNGALVYCLEYLLDNFDWLEEQLEPFVDGDYLCFDCPGQIELYTHFDVMRKIIDRLQK